MGAIAAEMYQARANRLGLDRETTLRQKGQIRLAAMLHDIGKVGVSDLLLKKPGSLSEAETAVMRSCILRVFRSVRLKALSVNSVEVAFFLRITVRYFDKTQGITYNVCTL